jgi:murein DD-endopeptidase MepM/ murein hydrolase activator NlpD
MKILISESQYNYIKSKYTKIDEQENPLERIFKLALKGKDDEEDNEDSSEESSSNFEIGSEVDSLSSSEKLSSPLKKFSVSPYSRFGVVRPGLDTKRPHSGADLHGAQGEPVYAPGDGTIRVSKKTGDNGGCGGTLYISHPSGLESRFCHLSDIFVNQGEKVKRGDKVGLVGGTRGTQGAGFSTGPHLHYTLARGTGADLLDPEKYVEKKFYDKDSDKYFSA